MLFKKTFSNIFIIITHIILFIINFTILLLKKDNLLQYFQLCVILFENS